MNDSGAMRALRRNRDFVLLQAGQLLSSAGSQATAIAYPLLVLSMSGSPAQAGLVSFAGLGASALLGLPAGVAADRFDRRRLMIAADVLRAVTIAALAAAVVLGDAPLGAIVAAAFVEGAATALFSVAEPGALRAVVPPAQFADAGGVLAGPPRHGERRRADARGRAVRARAGGAVRLRRGLLRRLDRLAARDARPLPGGPRPGDRPPLRAQLAEGLRFLWGQPFLRTCAAIYGVGNFLIPGIVLILLVQARAEGLSAGATGLLLTLFGVGTLAGSLASPMFRRTLSVRAILLMELWSWLWFWAFVAWPSVYVLTAAASRSASRCR